MNSFGFNSHITLCSIQSIQKCFISCPFHWNSPLCQHNIHFFCYLFRIFRRFSLAAIPVLIPHNQPVLTTSGADHIWKMLSDKRVCSMVYLMKFNYHELARMFLALLYWDWTLIVIFQSTR